MKILVLVLASEEEPFRYIREEGQLATWDSITVEGVDSLYYFSGSKTMRHLNRLYLKCPADYYMMHWRLKMALDYVSALGWDYIFRVSASAYVDKEKLLEFAHTLPKERCYAGLKFGAEFNGRQIEFASGAGFFLSRDTAEILREEIREHTDLADDVVVGRIMADYNIAVTPIYTHYFYQDGEPIERHYHYRCKGTGLNDGKDDVKAMKAIFNRFNR